MSLSRVIIIVLFCFLGERVYSMDNADKLSEAKGQIKTHFKSLEGITGKTPFAEEMIHALRYTALSVRFLKNKLLSSDSYDHNKRSPEELLVRTDLLDYLDELICSIKSSNALKRVLSSRNQVSKSAFDWGGC